MQEAKIPLLSVVMGVLYRRDNLFLLRRSVDSILAQSFRDFELLICDDGSSAEAAGLLEKYAAEDRRVRLIREGKLSRLPEKLNRCISEARGSFIARMDDDDFSHSERFERQLSALEQDTSCAFVGCNVRLWRDGMVVGLRQLPMRPEVRDFLFVQPFVHPAMIFRAEALSAVGNYCTEDRCELCEDYDLLLRLYARGYRGMNLQEALLDYTCPQNPHGNRRMRHRWNETVTRYVRFRELRLLPRALPYVVKPLAVGIIPAPLLRMMKEAAR